MGSQVHDQLPPTSSSSSLAISASAGPRLAGRSEPSSSAEALAVFRRLSSGEVTEEVLRLLLAAGAHLSNDRRLFRSLLALRLLLRLLLLVRLRRCW
jgi:hypothetical protein